MRLFFHYVTTTLTVLLFVDTTCSSYRADILKHEMKVFFVKYNDPIYVKLEKLDIMIRLASQGNIAQVLAELKEYATEVDVDFVRKSVRAIGRCAIKVEVSGPSLAATDICEMFCVSVLSQDSSISVHTSQIRPFNYDVRRFFIM